MLHGFPKVSLITPTAAYGDSRNQALPKKAASIKGKELKEMITPQAARREQILERSKDRLKRDIEKEITKLFDQVLDISEVAIGDAYRYKSFRAKVLRSGNDAIREVKKLLDRNYAIEFIPSIEDIIEVQSPPAITIRKQN